MWISYGNGRTCASSQYQAISLLPTRSGNEEFRLAWENESAIYKACDQAKHALYTPRDLGAAEQLPVSATASSSTGVWNEATIDSLLLAALEQFEDQAMTGCYSLHWRDMMWCCNKVGTRLEQHSFKRTPSTD